MDLKWHVSRSTEEPVLVDESSSDRVTIIRRNVHTVVVKNEMDDTETTLFEYDEAFPTKTEYALWLVYQENAEAHTNLELAVAEAVEAML